MKKYVLISMCVVLSSCGSKNEFEDEVYDLSRKIDELEIRISELEDNGVVVQHNYSNTGSYSSPPNNYTYQEKVEEKKVTKYALITVDMEGPYIQDGIKRTCVIKEFTGILSEDDKYKMIDTVISFLVIFPKSKITYKNIEEFDFYSDASKKQDSQIKASEMIIESKKRLDEIRNNSPL